MPWAEPRRVGENLLRQLQRHLRLAGLRIAIKYVFMSYA